MRIILASLFACFFHVANASIFDFKLWQADSKLNKEKYSAAINDYLKIQAKDPNNQRLNYNLGIGLYRKDNYKNAQFNFMQAAKSAKEPALKQKALYNLGNSLFMQEDYKNAITAYEEALKIDAKDEDAEFNLELAKKKLEEQNQNQDKDQENKDDQNQDQDKKDQENKENQNQKDKDKQDKDKQDQDQENKDKQDQSKQDQKKKNQDKQKQKPKEKKSELGEQEVKMLLMQVKEGTPQGGALGVKSKTNPDPKLREKPW